MLPPRPGARTPPARTSQETTHMVTFDHRRSDSMADARLAGTLGILVRAALRTRVSSINECRAKYKTVREPTDWGLLDREQGVSGGTQAEGTELLGVEKRGKHRINRTT